MPTWCFLLFDLFGWAMSRPCPMAVRGFPERFRLSLSHSRDGVSKSLSSKSKTTRPQDHCRCSQYQPCTVALSFHLPDPTIILPQDPPVCRHHHIFLFSASVSSSSTALKNTMSSEDADLGEKLSAPPDFNGPTSKRHMTDILCTVLLWCMWITMTGLGL